MPKKKDIEDILKNGEDDGLFKINKVVYQETIFPRAEYTTLSKSRQRTAYAETDGLGSNGYDRRHGTHRTFWRDRKEDRQRTDGESFNSVETYHKITSTNRRTDGEKTDGGGITFYRSGSQHPMHPLALSVWPLDSFHGGYISGCCDVQAAGQPTKLEDKPTRKNRAATGELYAQTERGFVSSSDGSHPREVSQCFFFYQHYGWPGTSESQEWPEEYFIPGPGKFKPGFPETEANQANKFHFKPQYSASTLSGLTPWYDSYEDYSDNINFIGKDYSILPEFKISEHMDYYLSSGFLAKNNKFLSLDGASITASSGDEINKDEINTDFYKIYSHSDFLHSFDLLKKKHPNKKVSEITLTCKGIKKMLPYQGFYPVLRCIQLGTLFSQSFGPNLTSSVSRQLGGEEYAASLLQPFFAPGIMYNTIKSGIAVDYPVFTGSTNIGDNVAYDYYGYLATGSDGTNKRYHNYRLPFEALVTPEKYIPVSDSSDLSNQINMVLSPSYSSGSANEAQANDALFNEDFAPHFLWNGKHNNNYNLAMHNFLGEIPRFFLEDERLTSFASKKGPFTMMSGSTYYMDVVLEKTNDFVMYEGPTIYMKETNPTTGIRYSSGSARGIHYGPACDILGGRRDTTHRLTGIDNSLYNFASNAQDPAFAPYTPPYFYGESVARISFSPHKHRELLSTEGPQTFTIDEILEGAKLETVYEPNRTASYSLAKNLSTNEEDTLDLQGYIIVPDNESLAGVGKMKIDSSVNLFGKTKVKQVEYSTEFGPDGNYVPVSFKDVEDGSFTVWTIGTKFETPTLDFSDNAKEHFTRGIWFGYGKQPKNKEGIFLRIRESFPQKVLESKGASLQTAEPSLLANAEIEETASLLQVCGFSTTATNSKRRIGRIAQSKKISEAIVAIPFRARKKDGSRAFFDIPRDYIEIAMKRAAPNIVNKYKKKGIEVGESIIEMVEKMNKYVIPPHHDFITNNSVAPFTMYIFEFEHVLDREDLSNIWQNLMPKIAREPELDEVSITHPCGIPGEFFEDGEIPKDIKWMIYKVKKKAERNYFNVTTDSSDDERFKFEFNIDSESTTPDYSYNWPYDFFSLVELAKVETSITLSNEEETK